MFPRRKQFMSSICPSPNKGIVKILNCIFQKNFDRHRRYIFVFAFRLRSSLTLPFSKYSFLFLLTTWGMLSEGKLEGTRQAKPNAVVAAARLEVVAVRHAAELSDDVPATAAQHTATTVIIPIFTPFPHIATHIMNC